MANCHRCNSPVIAKNYDGGEFYIICNVCGYYSSRSISDFFDNQAIFKDKTVEPLGVVVTQDSNIQYFSIKGRNDLIAKHKTAKGYTFYSNADKKWYYYKLLTKQITSVATIYETII